MSSDSSVETAIGTLLMLALMYCFGLYLTYRRKRRNGNKNRRSGRIYDRS